MADERTDEQKQLDVDVAQKVMGLVPCDGWARMNFGSAGGPALRKECTHGDKECYPTATFGGAFGSYHGTPAYSTEIKLAVETVEKMRERGFGWTICTHKDGWFVRCFELPDEGLQWRHSTVVSPTLPQAICKSALAALSEAARAKEVCGITA